MKAKKKSKRIKKSKGTKSTKSKSKYWRRRKTAESMPDEGARQAVAVGLARMFEKFIGLDFYNEDGPNVFPSWPSKTITLRYKSHNLSLDEMELLSKLNGLKNSEATDGNPSLDINIYARPETEQYRKDHSWLKKQDPKEWKEVLKYEYDGLFDIEIEFWFTENDWKKYGGYIEKVKKE